MMMWYTNTPPSGWILCDGQSTSSYPELAAVVGANVPNLKGRVPVGRDTGQTEFDVLGETGGANTHTLTVAQIPSHQHRTGLSSTQAFNASLTGGNTAQVSFSQDVTLSQATGGGQAHNNLQPYLVINYIIKT
jgi:microcystin-dependent protein